jgi:hypothetical protein
MHFIKNILKDHVLEVLYCPIVHQVVYILTKSLTKVRFQNFNLCWEFRKLSLKGDKLQCLIFYPIVSPL